MNPTELFVKGLLPDPFTYLGAHAERHDGHSGTVFRAYLPKATRVTAVLKTGELELAPGTEPNLFESFQPQPHQFEPYALRVCFGPEIKPSFFYDAYSFMPVLSEFDLFLWGQGNHYQIYHKLGAHPLIHQGINGVLFAVWAPSAKTVRVVGTDNFWDGRRHPMRPRGASGVWELFIPHIKTGALYKYEIHTQNDTLLIKTDPMAFYLEQRPKTASVVYDLGRYKWSDDRWLQERTKTDPLTRPMSIYEVHLGSWRKKNGWEWLNYREAANILVPYVQDMGFNWVEFLPLTEHPYDASWGYQVTGYYAATSRFGEPDDLRYLIDRFHQIGIGVILDWVPAHFPRDAYALEYFDGTHLYEHADPRQGEQHDWGTLIFNYGRNEVKNFLVANALFWVDQYHIDALRVDAVASMIYLDYSRQDGEWIPNRYGGKENLEALEFIKILNTKLYKFFPGALTIAEESTTYPAVSRPVHLGGLGFMFKWNMGWMHDMLDFIGKDPIHRRYHMDHLTFALLYAFHENFCLPLSHDEVVYGKRSLWNKMPGDYWQKCANLRLLLGYMFAEPGKKLIFMGGEFGQIDEWNYDTQLSWELLEHPAHLALATFTRDLNRFYLNEPALYEQDYNFNGFEWVDFRDKDTSVISFIRRGYRPEDEILFIFNFTPIVRQDYLLGAPRWGYYREIMNSDSTYYGGSNIGLGGGLHTEAIPAHGRSQSLNLTLPPIGFLALKQSS
ncbi:MAG: 1,4-alpha-glucan branching protein GlgB [Candidatus Adiutrix intracellularis]|jgi:1,4-alpha-glucan branching enzyme|nr:1,4-alpha-glucan branching protein GlgB [Candidatus Adiutrix intracellularis]